MHVFRMVYPSLDVKRDKRRLSLWGEKYHNAPVCGLDLVRDKEIPKTAVPNCLTTNPRCMGGWSFSNVILSAHSLVHYFLDERQLPLTISILYCVGIRVRSTPKRPLHRCPYAGVHTHLHL